MTMVEANRYSALRGISILMALDTAVLIVENGIFLMNTVLPADLRHGTPLNEIALYGAWTMWALRMLLWSLTLLSLSRLAGLRKSFGNARIWYLLRFLCFITQALAVTFANLGFRSPSGLTLSAEMLLMFLVITFLGELLLSVGNRVILFAGAELLNSFGLDTLAKENRRCGNRLLGCTAAQTLFFVAAVALFVWIRIFQGRRLSVEGEWAAPEWIGFFSAVLFCLLARLGVIAHKILAAAHMNRAYRAVKELTE